MKGTEHEIQAAFVQWLGVSKIPGIDLAFAVPNGGERNPIVGAKLKAEGVKRGMPDWFWPTRRGAFAGLAIEFKAGDGVPSKEQRERINALQLDGWLVVLCWDWQAAAQVVRGYAGMMRVGYPS